MKKVIDITIAEFMHDRLKLEKQVAELVAMFADKYKLETFTLVASAGVNMNFRGSTYIPDIPDNIYMRGTAQVTAYNFDPEYK